MAKKKNDPFAHLQGAATGIVGLGVTTAVGAGVAAQAPAGMGAGLTTGFSTLSGFVPVATTAVAGKTVLGLMPKSKPIKIKGVRVI